jgi:hypothetical protein
MGRPDEAEADGKFGESTEGRGVVHSVGKSPQTKEAQKARAKDCMQIMSASTICAPT